LADPKVIITWSTFSGSDQSQKFRQRHKSFLDKETQVGHGRPAVRDGAGLVEDDGRHFVRVLQRLRPLDEDAVDGADARAHHDGGGRGQTQAARAGDGQDGEGHSEGELPRDLLLVETLALHLINVKETKLK